MHLSLADRIRLLALGGVIAWFCAGTQSAWAADAARLRIVPGLEEPLVATAPTSGTEDRALDAALDAYRRPTDDAGDFATRAKPLVDFLSGHPATAWRTSLLTDLGIGYYHSGYFTRAEAAWRDAWRAGRNAADPQAKAIADRAYGELVRMHARVGHAEELEALFAERGDRPVSGPATEMVTGAHEGLWMFRNEWGTAYLCGPMALKNLLIALKAEPAKIAALDDVRSGPHGFTFAQVSRLASDAALDHRVIHRAPGQDVPVPSIVNWKVNHYAAIVGEKDGRYHLNDPTFGGGDLWVSKAAIDAESSGYFLVPAPKRSSLPWRTASAEEAGRIYGMGYTGQNQTGATTLLDYTLNTPPGSSQGAQSTSPTEPSCETKGMCVANAKLMVVSLNLNDTPVGYRPQKGPPAFIRLAYNQREAYQPAVFSFFNVSPKWTLNVLSYIQDDPTRVTYPVRYAAGGGAVDYSIYYGYNSDTGEFSPERQGQAVLVRIPASGPVTSYELRMPDGGKQIFTRADGATSFPRRIFLTQIIDPQGNALSFSYDAQLRLTAMTDATGRSTRFTYGATDPLLVTRITDPFGRSAVLSYDTGGRLSSITDVIGITSSFTYDAGGLINALTTPYGTSRFTYGDGINNTRFLEMTDPLGSTERVEFRHDAPGIGAIESVAPAGWDNYYLNYRNTFYWDKHVYPVTHTDYTKARLTHWLHNPKYETSPIVESVKNPLERRVWMRYPGQGTSIYEGTADTPTSKARVLDNNATQQSSFTYNAIGRPLSAIDPVGRKTVYAYDTNNIDLLSVQQVTSTSGTLSPIAGLKYNAQHRPVTYTDAAGQTTSYAYNAAGQLTGVTNALNETTGYSYDGIGRLTTITNANGVVQSSYTYDAFDRIATTTDSEGYTLAYSYDALDRVMQIRYPDGTTTAYGYDKLDRVSVKDRLNRVTAYGYDADRRLASVTDPLGLTTRYGYFENGVLASLTDPKGNITSWGIDIQSRTTGKRYANGDAESYVYEATTSRLKSRTDPMGQVKNWGYALDDRTASLSYVSATRPTPSVIFTDDPFFPRRVAMVDGIGTTTWAYQPVGAPGALQLALEDGPYNNDTIAYQYDALGRVSTRTVDVAPETFAYDRLGRLSQHSSVLGSFSRSYLGNTVQLTRQTNGSVGTTWTYDSNINDRRLMSVGNSGQARSFDIQTTPQNRAPSVSERIGAQFQRQWFYGFDASDRLTSASSSTGNSYSYSYDESDNSNSINGIPAYYNGANQLVSWKGTAYTYDANGNVLDDGIRVFKWDAEDRLTEIRLKVQNTATSQFYYDGVGRRLTAIEKSLSVHNEIRQLWCGDFVCQARGIDDSVVRRYFAEGVFTPQGAQALYYHVDQLGSIRDVSVVPTGSKVASYDYEPYGAVLLSSGRVPIDYRFAGMLLHAQSGLYLTKYRAYDPSTARWLSREPKGQSRSGNVYAYVDDSPITNIDALGHSKKEVISAAEKATEKALEEIAEMCKKLNEGIEEASKTFDAGAAVQSSQAGNAKQQGSMAACVKEDAEVCVQGQADASSTPKDGMQLIKTIPRLFPGSTVSAPEKAEKPEKAKPVVTQPNPSPTPAPVGKAIIIIYPAV